MQNDNPHTDSHQHILLDAFNLIPGATYMVLDQPDPRIWVAEKVARDGNFERVYVWAHDATDHDAGIGSGLSFEIAHSFDYATKVALVGIVVNHDDHDDNNWGAGSDNLTA